MSRRLLASVAVASAALLLSGCTARAATDAGGTAPVAAPSSPAAPASSASPPPPPRPPLHGCYRLPFKELALPTTNRPPVPCTGRHDLQTIRVGTLPADATVASSGRHVQRVCERALERHLGGSRETRRLSRFTVVWFGPDQAAIDTGADWFRCDLVAFSTDDNLLALPRQTHGLLQDPAHLSTYGLCGSAAPGSADFVRVICSHRHAWQAIATIHIPGRHYPRRAELNSAGDAACQDKARARAGFALQFQYGWEWPSRSQWVNRQHFGYCWAPSS